MTKAWIKSWGPAVLLMAIIFFASDTPGSNLPRFGTWDVVAKKGGHMIGYALLASAYFHALGMHLNTIRTKFITAAFLALLYASSDEFHQKFIQERTASISDVLIDMSGALTGLGILLWSRKKFGVKSKNPGFSSEL